MAPVPPKQDRLDGLWREIQNTLLDSAWAEAEGLLRRYAQLVPDVPLEVWDGLAYALLMQADFRGCLEVLEPWRQHPERSFWVNHKVGDALRGLHRLEAAVDAYEMALLDGSDSALTVRNLLQVLDQLDSKLALKRWQRWCALGPRAPFVIEGAHLAAQLLPGLELAALLNESLEADAGCRRRLLEEAVYALDWSTCAAVLNAAAASDMSDWELQLQRRLGDFQLLPGVA